MNKSKVTIILTSYNRPKYVKSAIESVLAQTYKNWELFIMDDNSNEETQMVLEDYMGDDRITIVDSEISKEDRETTGCRYAHLINKAIEMSDGEFVTYLTDDDFYYPNRLEVMVKHLEVYPDMVDIVYGWQQKISVDKYGVETLIDVRRPANILNTGAFNIDHNSFMHRRSCFAKAGVWPIEDLRCGDAAFFQSLSSAGYVLYPVNEITDAKRYHPFTISAKLDRGEKPLEGINEV